MKIQFENMRGNASPRGVGTNVPAFTRLGQMPRNLLSACRAAFLDICAVLAAFLLVTATGLGLAFALFVALFVKL